MPPIEPAGTAPLEPPPTPLPELRDIVRVSLFAALVGAGAFIHIPFGPMFLSLQTMMIMLAGFILGPRRAILAMLVYLACGFIGLPVFGRGRAGPAAFFGPTFGYLAGFVAGAATAGLSVYFRGGRKRRVAAMIGFGAAGTVLLLGLGTLWLRYAVIDNWPTALAVGLYTFLPGDLLKMLAAAAVKETFFSDGD